MDSYPTAYELKTEQLRNALQSARGNFDPHLPTVAMSLVSTASERQFADAASLLVSVCGHCFQSGKSSEAIILARALAERARVGMHGHVQRRVQNALGGYYVDASDFTSAMRCFDSALSLASQLRDPVAQAASLANVATLMQEMGHYRQAIDLSKQVLSLQSTSEAALGLKSQCSATGLFSAHRIGERDAATLFLQQGQLYIKYAFGDLGRAFFEKDRALFLIDIDRGAEAHAFIEQAVAEIDSTQNARVATLLGISGAMCDWAIGKKVTAQQKLLEMYSASRSSRLYHHLVLQALIKTHGADASVADAAAGLKFARELVEYTMSVKRAKFYRQLANRISAKGTTTSHTTSDIDPMAAAREWLTSTNVSAAGDDPAEAQRPVELVKHEELTAIHEDMARLRVASIRREIRTDAVDTAENWAIAAEFFDDETGQHCYRVGHLAAMLAREVGMDETFCIQVEHAARLHDIGKIAVNEVILLKPGPLDASEMAAMRLHTEVGAQILSGSDDPTLRMATEIARHHHEWWNGAGYPTRIAGNEIPLSARVCAYADVYDALTHVRAYKQAWPHERAVAEIVRLGGTQFDPDLLDPFLSVLDRYRLDLERQCIPAFADMDSNALIASRKKLMETISAAA